MAGDTRLYDSHCHLIVSITMIRTRDTCSAAHCSTWQPLQARTQARMLSVRLCTAG